jgi:hypothetical protein
LLRRNEYYNKSKLTLKINISREKNIKSCEKSAKFFAEFEYLSKPTTWIDFVNPIASIFTTALKDKYTIEIDNKLEQNLQKCEVQHSGKDIFYDAAEDKIYIQMMRGNDGETIINLRVFESVVDVDNVVLIEAEPKHMLVRTGDLFYSIEEGSIYNLDGSLAYSGGNGIAGISGFSYEVKNHTGDAYTDHGYVM